MEWSRAKKYTIIILIILNLVLLCLNIYKGLETRLGSERIKDVISLLKAEGITVECPLPRDYSPLAEITTSDYSFDYIKLEKTFMEGETNVKRTDEYNSVVFISDNSRIVIKGSSVNFTSQYAREFNNDNDVKVYTDKMVKRINENFGSYKFHSLYETDEGYIVKYYEKFNGRNVYSNFAYFTVKGKNIALALNYTKLGNELSEKNSIYAADEALYAADDYIKEDNKNARITSIELGYYVIGSNYGGEDFAIPFYNITAENKEYYVNAYTGECF